MEIGKHVSVNNSLEVVDPDKSGEMVCLQVKFVDS